MQHQLEHLKQSAATALLATLAVVASMIAYAVSANGIEFTRVLSASMEPALMAGDIAIIQPTPVREVHAGDIAVLQAPNAGGALYSHRLTEVQWVNGQTTVRTKGDNNPFIDPWQVELSADEVPLVVGRLPLPSLPLQALDPRLAAVSWLALLGYLAGRPFRKVSRAPLHLRNHPNQERLRTHQ